MLNVVVQRESVCMADDMEDHSIIVKIEEMKTLREFLLYMLNTKYLAKISGGKATWVLCCNDIILAVVAQEWDHPKYLQSPDAKITKFMEGNSKVEMNFKYLAQINPDKTYIELLESKGKEYSNL